MKKNYLPLSYMATLMVCLSGAPAFSAEFNCVAAPDCETLGYTMTAQDCADDMIVKCPTDPSKVYCKVKPKPASYIKFVINISNSCPSGLSFAGTWGNAALAQSGSFSCTSNYCYDQGRYDGNGSNETETIVLEESVITLSNLNSNFKSIKSQVTGRTVIVSNGEAYFTLNDRSTIIEKNNGGAGYDYWTLQCSQ